MIQSYFKTAIRYLFKNRLYSLINIFGLAIGIMSFILIMCYVSLEWSYDKFKDSNLVYRVFMDYLEGDQYVPGDANTYQLSGEYLTEKFPEIESYVRFRRLDGINFMVNRQVYDNHTVSMVDPSYFELFDHDLILGNQSVALEDPYSIVISTDMAVKMFGQDNPVGQKIELAFDGEMISFTVTGVLDFSDRHTHIPNDCLVSLGTYFKMPNFEEERKNIWSQNEFFTYLKISKGTNFNELNEKVKADDMGVEHERHHLEPLESIHLNSNKPYEAQVNGSARSVRMLAIIGFITILLSWINYANLTTSKSLERAREIGVRKVIGAGRFQLVGQFLLESIIINSLAVLLGIVLAFIVLPVFSSFAGYAFSLDGPMMQRLLPYLLIVLVGTSIVSFLPSFIIYKHKPTRVLKGKLSSSGRELLLRQALIIGQFVATICLLSGTFIAFKQIDYLKNKPLGTNLTQVLAIKGQVVNRSRDSLFHKDFDVVLGELRKRNFVKEVTVASTYPGEGYRYASSSIGITFPDGRVDEQYVWYNYSAWPNYFGAMEMEFVAGGPFVQNEQKRSNTVVVNETMMEFMGVQNPQNLIDETIEFWGQKWKVVGVLKDYSHFGLKTLTKPIVIRHNRTSANILVKLNDQAISVAGLGDAVQEIESIWHDVFPMSTFDYKFVDSQFEATYADEQRLAKVFPIFTLLSILIASLGLFGLTSYSILQRTKEIGIRKVNGATLMEILTLLNSNYIKWVLLAFIVAVPVAYFFMNRWLEGFAYRTTIDWWVFVLAGISTLLIAIITISFKSVKAAMVNPVESLRSE